MCVVCACVEFYQDIRECVCALNSPCSWLIKHPLSLEMKEQLSSIHKVQDKVQLAGCLEGVMESHKEWVLNIHQEDIPLSHDVPYFISSDD